ncbi:guanine nucleotide binding protein, alpha subunit [Peniophora sp. CONT]|nr:guanine nucleotide binding protein, alpha subunit [Peniophora sp. CONT]
MESSSAPCTRETPGARRRLLWTAVRRRRFKTDNVAKQVSNSIDRQIARDKKKRKEEIKLLLLGQSESGKSTTLKQFQIVHTPAAFHAERIAWRPVIYLNIVQSICSILEAMSLGLNEDLGELRTVTARASVGQPSGGTASSDTGIEQRYQYYTERLRPILDLEERLIAILAENGEVEATRLGDGSSLDWSVRSDSGRSSSFVRTSVPASSLSLHRLHREIAVRPTSNWKKAVSLSRVNSHPAIPDRWWDDPSDPVHVLTQCARDMSALWADPVVRMWLTVQGIQPAETSGFYLDELDRITAMKYIPTDDDVLRARLKTTGVNEHTFAVSAGYHKRTVWKIFDVGGARNQRQAWVPYFTDVDAIIFLAPISTFDQRLDEDPRVNRLEDSLLLWRFVVSNKLLQGVSLVLFLNKCDLLKAKLESGVSVNRYISTYGQRPNDYESVSQYLRSKFCRIHQEHTPNRERRLYIHFTTVTDTRQTSTLIHDVSDSVLRENLKNMDVAG